MTVKCSYPPKQLSIISEVDQHLRAVLYASHQDGQGAFRKLLLLVLFNHRGGIRRGRGAVVWGWSVCEKREKKIGLECEKKANMVCIHIKESTHLILSKKETGKN